jgi:hypothetical protein
MRFYGNAVGFSNTPISTKPGRNSTNTIEIDKYLRANRALKRIEKHEMT